MENRPFSESTLSSFAFQKDINSRSIKSVNRIAKFGVAFVILLQLYDCLKKEHASLQCKSQLSVHKAEKEILRLSELGIDRCLKDFVKNSDEWADDAINYHLFLKELKDVTDFMNQDVVDDIVDKYASALGYDDDYHLFMDQLGYYSLLSYALFLYFSGNMNYVKLIKFIEDLSNNHRMYSVYERFNLCLYIGLMNDLANMYFYMDLEEKLRSLYG